MHRNTVYRAWPDALEDAVCDAIIAAGDGVTQVPAAVGSSTEDRGRVDRRTRRTTVGFLNAEHWVNGLVMHMRGSPTTRPGGSTAAGNGLGVFGVYRKQLRAKLAWIWTRFREKAPEAARLAFLVPSAKKGEQLMDDLGAPGKDHAIPIPIRPRMERDEGRSDSFNLVAYAAADFVAAPAEATLKKLAVALETCVALSTRKTVSAAEIEKLFAAKSRAASALRDLLRTKGVTVDPVALAPILLDAMEQDKRFESAAKSIRRQGAPRVAPCERHGGSLFDGYRISRAPRMEGHVPSRSRTTLLSMHRCKGREFEYVVMVVDPHAHRANSDVDELRRLHYVAATRAKRWLGVVYVRNDLGSVLRPVIG